MADSGHVRTGHLAARSAVVSELVRIYGNRIEGGRREGGDSSSGTGNRGSLGFRVRVRTGGGRGRNRELGFPGGEQVQWSEVEQS